MWGTQTSFVQMQFHCFACPTILINVGGNPRSMRSRLAQYQGLPTILPIGPPYHWMQKASDPADRTPRQKKRRIPEEYKQATRKTLLVYTVLRLVYLQQQLRIHCISKNIICQSLINGLLLLSLVRKFKLTSWQLFEQVLYSLPETIF